MATSKTQVAQAGRRKVLEVTPGPLSARGIPGGVIEPHTYTYSRGSWGGVLTFGVRADLLFLEHGFFVFTMGVSKRSRRIYWRA